MVRPQRLTTRVSGSNRTLSGPKRLGWITRKAPRGTKTPYKKRLVDESRRTLRLVDAAARIHTPRNISQRATYASNCSTKKDTKRDRAKFRPPLAVLLLIASAMADTAVLQLIEM